MGAGAGPPERGRRRQDHPSARAGRRGGHAVMKTGLDDFLVRQGPDALRALMEKAHTPVEPAPAVGTEKPKAANTESKGRPSQAEVLLALACEAELFHGTDGRGYALVTLGDASDSPQETFPVRSKGFRDWLALEYFRTTGRAACSQSTHDALGVLEARARFDGEQHPVYHRIGAAGKSIVLDLADAEHRCVIITAEGWTVRKRRPVRRAGKSRESGGR